jgi:hypothetical protein
LVAALIAVCDFPLLKPFYYLFNVQDGLSDVPSAPPIHDYDQVHSTTTHNVTQSCANTNLSDGLAAKKEHHHEANEGANLHDKKKR